MNVKGCTFRVCCMMSCNGCEVPIGGKFTQLKRTRLATLGSLTGVSILSSGSCKEMVVVVE